jgi:hypothetical protein
MVVSKFSLPTQVDADLSVLARIAAAFAPHASDVPAMSLVLDPGHLVANGTLIEVPAQVLPGITPPVSQPRIDRVVVSTTTGIASLINGTESANPVPPVLPGGVAPVAQVALSVGTSAITDALVIDERDFGRFGEPSGTLFSVRRFATSGTYDPAPGTTAIIVEAIGGGGSGGGCAAPSAGQGAAAGGGSSGAVARTRLAAGFTGVAVTVGAGGAATAAGANNGSPGVASSFGSLLTAPGGRGGYAGPAYAPPAIVGGAPSGASPTGGDLIAGLGSPGSGGLVLGATVVLGGNGGSSVFGGGGNGGGNAPGGAGGAPGAAGGGASSISNTPARSGGAGANGLVTVYEFH